ncbi:periplasmic amidohydrolase [Parapedobacter pyrenivorans]|uniref:Periplasmic amidohydrolase n=1 Tax=Parapedobacter pyrenivorans TaxID=1305674 RepID=A0A917I292_9SPHI|nr:amidohydrolase family protein [Parapedobacter pyrenivorans]GGH04579.1 periplasmic amidohydrolase [Parapedobacter pyrenivorans]
MKRYILFICSLLFAGLAVAQETYPVNGSHDERPRLFALTNANIVVKAGNIIRNGTLLVDGQRIAALGKSQSVPKGYVTIDLQGKFIYPSFIDAFSEYGQPKESQGRQQGSGGRRTQLFESTKKGPYGWNEAIRPETTAKARFTVDQKQSEELKKIGFGAIQSIVRDGIARGSSVVATLAEARENEVIILPEAGAHYSFSKGSAQTSYPSSLMGTIALLRQTYYDSQWYATQQKEYNMSLEAFGKLQSLPQFFEVDDVLDIFRADQIAKEFGKSYIIKTGGDAYQRLADIKATNASLIVPLDFPKAYDVEDPADARNVTLAQLKHWEMAPANPAMLEKSGIRFAISPIGLDNLRDFWINLRLALDHGLSQEYALRALTEIPAEMLGLSDKLGTLEKGKRANFIIASDTLFKEGTVIYENWVQGKAFVVTRSNAKDITGEYAANIPGIGPARLFIDEGKGKLTAHLTTGGDTTETKVTATRTGDLLSFSFNPKGQQGSTRISGYIADDDPLTLKGEVVEPDGTSSSWMAAYTDSYTAKTSGSQRKKESVGKGEVIYPFVAYGDAALPRAETVLIKNATVWTNEGEGTLQHADVLLADGKIKAVGQNLSAAGAKVIDGTGKHVTPGIIDEHSHIAISRGVNEGSHSVTAEVRIGDVINSEDINIYRQLAGGVTTSHLLHGSANSIGGQSQLIKLRWGQNPEGLKFGGNDGFIKFALGENVKQSNWGITGTRFPQTRMGVEQVFYDAFTRAKEYKARVVADDPTLRRDLTLETLVEILDKKRFITCHSYVQSEINMLMHVGDSMGFKVNTFTHILEGYKVADEMAGRQIAGASFADWWAYKMEVQEAIPYNAYLMHKRNVLTAINSDDAEMARRLNQEAAKAVKYGGVSEEEALKMVTLNVAEILHIDDRVGSLAPGKDADVVIWSDKPLSIYAKAEKTFVDGVKYWDIDEDAAKQQAVKAEKGRLIRKSLQAKIKGSVTQRTVAQPNMEYHCDTIGEIGEFEEYMD